MRSIEQGRGAMMALRFLSFWRRTRNPIMMLGQSAVLAYSAQNKRAKAVDSYRWVLATP
jgi:hypothetical protein